MWFPGVLVQGPEVIILQGQPEEYRWIVTWWTERQGPVPLVVPFSVRT